MDKTCNELKERILVATKNEPGIFALAVTDLRTGQELITDSRPMRSASLIKLYIMAEAFARIRAGSLLPATTLCFRETDRVAGAGILQQLPAGASRTLLELLELMITESDNIATNLLIDSLGTQAINERIQKLGCSETVLRRKMMDFAAAAAGQENLTSATDVARMLTKLHRGQCVGSPEDGLMRQILGRQTDRCKIPLLLPPETVCQHKTGELPGAEHDAGIVLCPAGPYVIAIMSEGQPDAKKRFTPLRKYPRRFSTGFVTQSDIYPIPF